MTPLFLFIALALLAAGLFIAGAAVIAGTGAALFVAGICATIAALFIQRGLANG